MKSRSARLVLFVLFALALAVTAYLFRKSEAAEQAEAAAGQVYSAKARDAARHVLDLRAAQQAYVATGQGQNFWTARVTQTLDSLRGSLTALRASAASAESQSSIDAAALSIAAMAVSVSSLPFEKIMSAASMSWLVRTYSRALASICTKSCKAPAAASSLDWLSAEAAEARRAVRLPRRLSSV